MSSRTIPESRLVAAAQGRPVRRLTVTVFLIVVCFCALCGKVLFDARSSAWDRAAAVATSLVATLESEIARNIESYDLSLQAVVDNLAFPDIASISPALRQLVLFDRSANAKHLASIVLLDHDGVVRLDSRAPFPRPVSRADRSYFRFHRDSGESRLHISEPIVARESGIPVVVVSRRLSNPDGSFAGVVAGSIKLSYFEDLLKRAVLGAHGNITLATTDGTLLMRWPYRPDMIGSSLKGAELYKHLANSPRGQFETEAVTDGIRRLVVYSRIGNLPLVIGVGQSTDDIYERWREYAFTIVQLLGLLCVISIGLVAYLAREMKRRGEAERQLAVLATTDNLTGLSNRFELDRAFDREWRRAMREEQPLSLMMGDADSFKSYNDQHGHQTGDRLLQAVARAIGENIGRGTDVAARYGGDEFVILLPATPAEAAAAVAERIRVRLQELCDELSIPRSALSVGVASIVPRLGDDPAALLSAADRALYRAKQLGRNRIEIEPRLNPLVVVSRSTAA